MYHVAFFSSVPPKERTQQKDRIWSVDPPILYNARSSAGCLDTCTQRCTYTHTSRAFTVFLVFMGIGEQRSQFKGCFPCLESGLTFCTDSQALAGMRTWNAPKFLYLGLEVWGLPLSEVGLKSRIQGGTKEIGTQAEKRSDLFVLVFQGKVHYPSLCLSVTCALCLSCCYYFMTRRKNPHPLVYFCLLI